MLAVRLVTFVPARLSGDRITLKDGSHWTISKCFGRLGIDDHYEVAEGGVERIVYSDEIASPAPVMRGNQSFGRSFRPAFDHAEAAAELERKRAVPIMDFETHSCAPLRLGEPSRVIVVRGDVPYVEVPIERPHGGSSIDLGNVRFFPCDFSEVEMRVLMDRDK